MRRTNRGSIYDPGAHLLDMVLTAKLRYTSVFRQDSDSHFSVDSVPCIAEARSTIVNNRLP